MFRHGCPRFSCLRLPTAGVSTNLLRSRCRPPSWLKRSFTRNFITTTTTRLPSLQLSKRMDPTALMMDLSSDLFNYTTERFLANEAFHLRERRRVFDIPGLFKIVAQAFQCQAEDIVGFRKLGEGGLNRVFLITLNDGFRLVARIPYPLLVPKAYVLASEVATMDFLRSKDLPIPKVYSYSLTCENQAGTEYILMEYVEGTDLTELWFGLREEEIMSLMDQISKLESIMMTISFPVGGSIYYTTDLKELSGEDGGPLDQQINQQVDSTPVEKKFCIGPEGTLTIDENGKSVLIAGAEKELAYLDQFGSPRAPYQHFWREYYCYKKQPPSDHVRNLKHYIRLAPALVPDDDSLNCFCIRHPNLTENNIKVSTGSSGLQIISVLDWQHSVVLPIFLLAGTPNRFLNEEDEVLERMIRPELPGDFDNLGADKQEEEMERLRRRLVHYHYNLSTAKHNRIHHECLVDPLNCFRRRIFNHATVAWEGETIKLLSALIEMVLNWEYFSKDGTPCPVVFTEDEMNAAEKLLQDLAIADRGERQLKNIVGYGEETWVPAAHYEEAKACGEMIKQRALKACTEVEDTGEDVYAMIQANWPLDDIDEAELEEYK